VWVVVWEANRQERELAGRPPLGLPRRLESLPTPGQFLIKSLNQPNGGSQTKKEPCLALFWFVAATTGMEPLVRHGSQIDTVPYFTCHLAGAARA